jgi:peptide/nickel transport system permease protein
VSDDIPPDDDPEGDHHDSIPLLLARPSSQEIATAVTRARTSKRPPPATAAPPLGGVRWKARGVLGSRLGAAGLLVVAFLALIAIFADVLASDLPIACSVHGRVYLFPNVTRPLDLAARDPAALARDTDWSIGALVSHGPAAQAQAQVLVAPGVERGHPLGTDRRGRDIFARIVHGTRSYLAFALAAVGASIALGAFLGAIAGLFGGATDALLGRAIESISAFPPLVLVLGIQAALPRPTILTLFLAIALTRWPEVARLVRGEVMLAATRDYALAARALGTSPRTSADRSRSPPRWASRRSSSRRHRSTSCASAYRVMRRRGARR